jgi:hypothetical protein
MELSNEFNGIDGRIQWIRLQKQAVLYAETGKLTTHKQQKRREKALECLRRYTSIHEQNVGRCRGGTAYPPEIGERRPHPLPFCASILAIILQKASYMADVKTRKPSTCFLVQPFPSHFRVGVGVGWA